MSGTHYDLEEHGHEGVKPSAEAGRHAARIRAIETLLVEKGVLTEEDVRACLRYAADVMEGEEIVPAFVLRRRMASSRAWSSCSTRAPTSGRSAT